MSKMGKYSCNGMEHKYWLSYICTNGSDTTGFECYNEYYTSNHTAHIIRKGLGIWFILIASFGIFGNLYTLLSIPVAARRKQFGFDQNFQTNTIFILHLCFIDFLNCITYILPHGIIHLQEQWLFPPFGCSFIVIMGMVTVSADAITLALIAISRCLNMIIPQRWENFCGTNSKLGLLLISVWVVSGIQLIPFGFKNYGVEPGWDCEIGVCGFKTTCMVLDNTTIQKFIGDPEKICHHSFSEGITVMSSYVFIVYGMCIASISTSYLIIFYKSRNSRKEVERSGNKNADLNNRVIKMTWTISILIILNITCWLPYQIFNILIFDVFGPNFEHFYYDIVTALYFTQFSLNFFVYVARSEQYRKAFVYYGSYLKLKMKFY